ncbi:MAG: DUF4214 domain-containing protein [Pseudomonadota bacterium]|nr:DUF4214 domain-containing protein [Pseudomonadota bacterium]
MVLDLGVDQPHFLVLLQPQAHDARAIVNALYLVLLGRPADAEGVAHHVEKLANRTTISSIARSIHYSQEGRAYAVRFPKTKAYYRAYTWTTFPIFGKHYAKALVSRIKSKERATAAQAARQANNVVLFDTSCAASPAALKLLAAINAERLRQC